MHLDYQQKNYAMQTGKHPRIVTDENIKVFTGQLKQAGYSFDWSRTVDTTDPNYYKWTQWIFLQLFKHNLALKINHTLISVIIVRLFLLMKNHKTVFVIDAVVKLFKWKKM